MWRGWWAEGRRVLLVITYHFSKGDPRRGCAGFGHDTAAAHAHARQIRTQVEHIFGADHGTVYPLVCGFETDEDALILHGPGAGTSTWPSHGRRPADPRTSPRGISTRYAGSHT